MAMIKTQIRHYRLTRYSSAAAVAEAAKVKVDRYSAFEAGRQYAILRPDEIERVAALLGLPPSAIADNSGHPLPFIVDR